MNSGYCDLSEYDFGILPGAVMIGPYNTAKNTFATTVGQAADLVRSMATAMANVAKVHGAAESANQLMAPQTTLPDAGLGYSGGTGGFTAEGVALIVDIGLYATFAAISAVCDACAALTPAALVAVAAWALTEPIDDGITGAISGWQSAKIDVNAAKGALEDIVSRIDDGWDREDSARPAFDDWWRRFDDDLDRLKDGIDKIPDKLQDALQELRTIHGTLFVAALAALTALVALTGLDVFFGAGEAAKVATAIGLNSGVWASIAAIVAVLITVTGTMIDMSSKASGFSVSAPGDHTVPNFQEVAINWSPRPSP